MSLLLGLAKGGFCQGVKHFFGPPTTTTRNLDPITKILFGPPSTFFGIAHAPNKNL